MSDKTDSLKKRLEAHLDNSSIPASLFLDAIRLCNKHSKLDSELRESLIYQEEVMKDRMQKGLEIALKDKQISMLTDQRNHWIELALQHENKTKEEAIADCKRSISRVMAILKNRQ